MARHSPYSADAESSPAWFAGLARLNAVVASFGEPLDGNLCYPHLCPDYAPRVPVPELRVERDRLRRALAGRQHLLEIGANGGQSAYIALTSNPELHYHGVDIGMHDYVGGAVEWLAAEFPCRLAYDEGSCLKVVPRVARQGRRFDAFHIDGAKQTYCSDIVTCSGMIDGDEVVVVVDDTLLPVVARTWDRCVRHGLVQPVPGEAPAHAASRVARLHPGTAGRRTVLAAHARCLLAVRMLLMRPLAAVGHPRRTARSIERRLHARFRVTG